MSGHLKGRNLISITDLTKSEILQVLKLSKIFKEKSFPELLKKYILANCFFEPSTRTRLSFETAMLRCGGKTIGFSDTKSTSIEKKESLSDSIKIISKYADIITIRHPYEGSALQAAESSSVPVINAGDGANQHPTQTLIDLFSILESQGTLDDLNIAIIGDLKYARTVHSLVIALALFKTRLFFVSPEMLTLPDEIISIIKKHGIKFSFHKTIDEVLSKLDILYMTRIQEERLSNYEMSEVKNNCMLKIEHFRSVKKTLRVLHPLPRVDEIEITIDHTPYAYYFTQAENGVYIRQALLALILGEFDL